MRPQFTVKHLRRNEYTHSEDEVAPGSYYGYWCVVEHTGAGWFPVTGAIVGYTSQLGRRFSDKAMALLTCERFNENPRLASTWPWPRERW